MPMGKGTYGSQKGRPSKKRNEYKVGSFIKGFGKTITSNVLKTPKLAGKIASNQVKGTLGVAKKITENLTDAPKNIVQTNKQTLNNLKNFATDKNYRRQNFKDIGDAFRRNKNYSGGHIAGPN
jgi:hypothetical protein